MSVLRAFRRYSAPRVKSWGKYGSVYVVAVCDLPCIIIIGVASYSTETTPTQEPSRFMQLAASKGLDKTSPYVWVQDSRCYSPKEANTNLVDFLNRSDVIKRRTNLRIPFFTAGSYISVTRADPHSPSGESTFAGICISRRKNMQLGSTFVLRNIVNTIGIEMMYELYSPAIKEIKVLKLERRRRAKLYYLRDKPPKYSTVNEKMEAVKVVSDGTIPVHHRRGALA